MPDKDTLVQEQPVGAPTTKERLTFWTFINSSFALWALSTVAVGLGVYTFQSRQGAREADRKYQERVSHLTFEAAGRLSHFLTWSYTHLMKESGEHGKFKDDVSVDTLKTALETWLRIPTAMPIRPESLCRQKC